MVGFHSLHQSQRYNCPANNASPLFPSCFLFFSFISVFGWDDRPGSCQMSSDQFRQSLAEPRWWPGLIPWCSRPRQLQAHWGVMSAASPWKWGNKHRLTPLRPGGISEESPRITPTPKSVTISCCCILEFHSECASPSVSWQCSPCEACWECWWDVRLDLQV